MSCDIFNKINNYKCSYDIISNYDTNLITKLFNSSDDYTTNPYNKEYKINYILDSNNNYPYSLCSIINDKPKDNCSLKLKSPWATTTPDGTGCSLPNDIELPPNFTRDGIKIIPPTPKNKKNYLAWAPKERFYEERWYDWFLIPNYHLGNNYYQQKKDTDDDLIIYGNYLPCDNNLLPYASDSNNYTKCVSKEYAYNGLFNDELHFSPLAFIVLLGANIYDYNLLYIQNLYKKIDNINKENKYSFKNNKYIDIDLNSKILSSNYFYETYIYKAAAITVSGFNPNIFYAQDKTSFMNSYAYISENNTNKYEIYNRVKITNDYLIKNMFNGEDYLSYKNTKVKCPDINLINVMDQYNCFDVNILKICYNIAKRYYKNYKDTDKAQLTEAAIKLSFSTFTQMANYNIPEAIIPGVDSYESYTIEKNIFLYFFRYIIRDKNNGLYATITDYKNDNNNYDELIKKCIVLSNVFKKFVNICFDNKSEFSNYIFALFKETDDYFRYKDPIIFEDEAFISVDKDNINNNNNNSNYINVYYTIGVIIILIIFVIYISIVSYTTSIITILTLIVGIVSVYYITKSYGEKTNEDDKPFQNIQIPSLITIVYIFITIFVIIIILSIIFMIVSFFGEYFIRGINYIDILWGSATTDNNQKLLNIQIKNVERASNKITKIKEILEKKKNEKKKNEKENSK